MRFLRPPPIRSLHRLPWSKQHRAQVAGAAEEKARLEKLSEVGDGKRLPSPFAHR